MPAGQQNNSLVVFCKRPAMGQGKQRLAETIGAERAFRIAQCLLNCALEDAVAWQAESAGQVVLSPASQTDGAWARSLLPSPVTIVAQQPGNLGQRLQQVDNQLRAAGRHKLIFMGTDAPLLQTADLLAAGQLLHSHDVVLQPADDGGVTLMSASRHWPPLQQLPWSADNLQQSLCAACLAQGASVWLQPGSQDVDDWPGLHRLLPALADDQRPARRALLSCVREYQASV